MLKIDTIESTSEIVFSLHGRLAGPWVDELESHWRRTQATAGERLVTVDLSGVTGIDGAARYLLQLMRVKNVGLMGACLSCTQAACTRCAFVRAQALRPVLTASRQCVGQRALPGLSRSA